MMKITRMLGMTILVTSVLVHLPGSVHAGSSILYVANGTNGTVRQFSGSGADLGNLATGLIQPFGIAADGAGNVYVDDYGGDRLVEYSPQGTVKLTIATPFTPGGIVVTASGNILTNDYFGSGVYEYSPTGQSLGLFCSLGFLRAQFMTLDAQGNLYVAVDESGVWAVRKISPTGVDEGNLFTTAQGLDGITVDSQGNLYAAIGINMIREYSPTGQDLGLFTSTGLDIPDGIVFGQNGNLFVANNGNNTIAEFSPSGTYLGVFASTGMDGPAGLVFGSAVPEPSAFWLMSIGVIVGSVFLRRRIARGSLASRRLDTRS